MIIVGDSISGDIGSGLRFQELEENKSQKVGVEGLLVVSNEASLREAKETIQRDSQLQKLVASFNVKAIQLDKVSMSSLDGLPHLASRYREEFIKDIGV